MIPFSHKSIISLSIMKAVIDQIEYPCLLWDQEHDKVIQVNKQWEELTNINLEDLIDISISKILPNYKENNQDPSTIIINTKNDARIECLHKDILLDNEHKLVLVKFFPVESSAFKLKINQNTLEEKILSLLNLDCEKGFIHLADAIISILNDFYDCFTTEIYLNFETSNLLSLLSSNGEKNLFPKDLNVDEINFSKPIDFWRPGDRALDTIQRIARQEGLTLFVTARFLVNENYKGLLLLSFKNQIISESDFFILPILIAIIRIIFNKAILFHKENNNLEQGIFIGKHIENILNKANIGLLIVDKERHIRFSNPCIEKLFGYEKWEMASESVSEIISTFDLNIYFTNDFNSEGYKDLNLRKRDGTNFPARLFIQKFQNENITDEGFQIIFIEDLTQLNNLQTEVAQLSRQAEMGVLVASFAHDVRNVFNSIKLNADVAQLVASDKNDIKDKMISIKEDCDEVNQLMESVLSFSSSFEKNKKPLDIKFLIERLIERWRPKLDRNQIKTYLQADEEIPYIIGDARSLEQVFNNLISNARDAMNQKGGSLGVYIKKSILGKEPNNVDISISDTGAGIPEDNLSMIFDPYYSARPGGTGLGLAITKKIIEYHHGRLEVESFPGGTTFHVYLPTNQVGETK